MKFYERGRELGSACQVQQKLTKEEYESQGEKAAQSYKRVMARATFRTGWNSAWQEEEEIPPEATAAAASALNDLVELIEGTSDKCPICKQPITKMEQIGRCVHMSPCGHHYQGLLPRERGTR